MEEIDLKELFEFFKKKIAIIVIIIASVCIIGCIRGLVMKTPLYSSSTTVVLKPANGGMTTSDVTVNKNLVATYAQIVKSRRILDQVIAELHLDIKYESLSGNISVSAINNTEIIKIRVSNKNPELARDIADATAEVFVAEIGDLYKMDNVSILDKASVSSKPYNINVLKQIFIYFMIGVVLGFGFAFVVFYFDRTIKSTEQIEQKIQTPILGRVQDTTKSDGKTLKSELVVKDKPKSNISEDIRTIRTNLQFTSSTEDNKVLLMTSSVPGEGKSFISSNLATAFAQTGEKVLLIDCDLRLGRLHKIFNVSNNKGLSQLLVGKNILECANYIQKTEIDNLYVIPRGVVPPNPSELLGSENTKKLVKVLREKFDHIIFDGVPVNGLPDSLILSSVVDRVVIASSYGYTKIDDLDGTKKALYKVNANIAGVVMNKAPQTRRGKYYSYYE